MNPEAAPETSPPGDAAFRFAGHWFIALGVVAFLSMPLAWIVDRRFSLDFSGILLFWLGTSLHRRGRWAWRIAVGLCLAGLGFLVALAVAAWLGRAREWRVFGAANPALDLALVGLGAGALVLLPPLAALLPPAARRLAGRPPGPRPPARFELLYGLLLVVLLPAGFSFSRQIKKETTSVGSSYLHGANGVSTWAVNIARSDGASPPRDEILIWIVGLGPDQDDRRDGDLLRISGREFRIEPGRSWILLPPAASQKSNIVLIAKDGRRIDVPRRVTMANILAAEAAAKGFRDLEDLEKRLLGALPE